MSIYDGPACIDTGTRPIQAPTITILHVEDPNWVATILDLEPYDLPHTPVQVTLLQGEHGGLTASAELTAGHKRVAKLRGREPFRRPAL